MKYAWGTQKTGNLIPLYMAGAVNAEGENTFLINNGTASSLYGDNGAMPNSFDPNNIKAVQMSTTLKSNLMVRKKDASNYIQQLKAIAESQIRDEDLTPEAFILNNFKDKERALFTGEDWLTRFNQSDGNDQNRMADDLFFKSNPHKVIINDIRIVLEAEAKEFSKIANEASKVMQSFRDAKARVKAKEDKIKKRTIRQKKLQLLNEKTRGANKQGTY